MHVLLLNSLLMQGMSIVYKRAIVNWTTGMGVFGRSISGKMASFKLSRSGQRSPTMKSTPISSNVNAVPADENHTEDNNYSGMYNLVDDGDNKHETLQAVLGRKIMIVVDLSRESKVALQWALSHIAQSHDTILLLNVVKTSSSLSPSSKNVVSHEDIDGVESNENPRSYHALLAMKKICQKKNPEVKVEICLVQGKEKGPVIVDMAKQQGASLLVLGSKKKRAIMTVMWRLLMPWRGRSFNSGGRAVVDYCIKNATCIAVAVRRRGRRAGGGYLISTRNHKNFWLLA